MNRAALSSAPASLLGLAVLSLRVRPGEPLTRIIPAGVFDAPRGALSGAGPWNLTPEAAAGVIAANATRTADICVDYEHQLLAADSNGQPAPASGWIDPRSLTWVGDGNEPGLYAQIKWTERAAELIAADEYRYLSPVFTYDGRTGEPLDVLHVALTNNPAINEPTRAALSARASNQPQENPVNETLKKLLAELGLPGTTSEGDALAAVAALKAKGEAQVAEIASLKAAVPAHPDPAKYVPVQVVADMQQQLAALTGRMAEDEAGRLIEQAIGQGKLVEAQRTWATDLAKKDLAALKAYVATAPAIAALAGMQSGGNGPAPTGAQLTETELAVCKAMGLNADDYLKTKKAEA